MRFNTYTVLLLVVAAYVLFLGILGPGYYPWYPSIFPRGRSVEEAALVRDAIRRRTQKDIDFYYATDRDMDAVFEEVLREYDVSKDDIRALIRDPDLIRTIMWYKCVYNRVRPYQVDSVNIHPPSDSYTYHTPSHPAGHAAQAYFVARVYGAKYPQVADRLLEIAHRVDDARVKMGIHYPSDGVFARKIVDSFLTQR